MFFATVKTPSECGDACIQDGSGDMPVGHRVTPLVIDERITSAISRALCGQGEFSTRAVFEIIETGDEGFLCDLFHCVFFSILSFNVLTGTRLGFGNSLRFTL